MTEQGQDIRVLIVDDHHIVRQGISTFLGLTPGIKVIGEACDGAEAVEMVERIRPDVVLMDLVMPGVDGISATRHIKSLDGCIQVIALTSFGEEDKVIPAIRAGADSYLLKDVSPEALVDAIRAAHAGQVRLHPDVARKLLDRVAETGQSDGGEARGARLTGRELDVVRLVAQGRSNRQIAQALVISEKTVKSHVSNLLGKLGLDDRTQLAIHAISSGLIEEA